MSLQECPQARGANHNYSTWTEERTDLLKKLWDVGLSATQIAKEIGGTRNGIIGKAHRLKLPGRKSVILAGTHRVKQQRDHGRGAVLSIAQRETAANKKCKPPKFELGDPTKYDNDIPLEQRRTILTVGPGECRWPVGEPGVDLFFCGAACGEQTYCDHHHRIGVS